MKIDWNQIFAAIWRPKKEQLRPVIHVDPVSLDSLVGIDHQKSELIKNTERLMNAKPANNVLLWGARGTGKSSLIKAVLNDYKSRGLRLIEVNKDDLHSLPEIVDDIRELPQYFIIYCDDFSFESNDTTYVGLKSVLEGSIEQAPRNVLLYATSNRRHLMPEYMQDNKDTKVVGGELHFSDAVEEKIALSDRFGLCLSFYSVNLRDYLNIVDSYFPNYKGDRKILHEAAKLFSMTKASRSGRTAKQFYNYYSEQDD